jgi:outer membrane protein assembly factor BamB
VLLHEDLVIINACVESDCLIALDKRTGRERWRRKGLCCTWQTPIVVRSGASWELVVGARTRGFSMHGLDPGTGATLWTCDGLPGARDHDGAMTSPIAHDGVVFTHNHPKLSAVRAGGRGNVTSTHKLWEIDVFPIIPSPLYHDGHLYWVQEQGTVTCLKAASGKVVFHERLDPPPRLVYASPVLVGGRIYCLSRNDGVYVLAARPEFKILAHNVIKTDAGVFNASPAVSNGKLFLRSDRFLYCIGKSD